MTKRAFVKTISLQWTYAVVWVIISLMIIVLRGTVYLAGEGLALLLKTSEKLTIRLNDAITHEKLRRFISEVSSVIAALSK